MIDDPVFDWIAGHPEHAANVPQSGIDRRSADALLQLHADELLQLCSQRSQ